MSVHGSFSNADSPYIKEIDELSHKGPVGPNAELRQILLNQKIDVENKKETLKKIREQYEVSQDLSKGIKADVGKPVFHCLPQDALLELGRVAELGFRKYGPHNYRKGIKISRYIDAAFRHLIKATNGEDVDPEEGNNHWISVAWNVLAVYQSLLDDPSLDDRYKKESK